MKNKIGELKEISLFLDFHHGHFINITYGVLAQQETLWWVGEVGGGPLHVQEHLVLGEARERGELGEQVLPDQVAVLTAHPHHLRVKQVPGVATRNLC